MMVRDFHRVIGDETRAPDSRSAKAACPMPSSPASAAAATPSASSTPFLDDDGVQADRRRSRRPQRSSSASTPRASPADRPACCTARYSYLLQDDDGQVALTHSVSAGLDYASGRPRARLAARSAAAPNTAPSTTPTRSPPPRTLAPHRRHHSGARIRARGGRSHPPRARPSRKASLHRQSLRPRRQRHRHLSRKSAGTGQLIMPHRPASPSSFRTAVKRNAARP